MKTIKILIHFIKINFLPAQPRDRAFEYQIETNAHNAFNKKVNERWENMRMEFFVERGYNWENKLHI